MSEKIQPVLERSESLPDAHDRHAANRDEGRWLQGLQPERMQFPWQANSRQVTRSKRISDVSRYLQTSGAQGVYCTDCGAWNPEYKDECTICGTDLARVTPIDERKEIEQDISLVTINEDGSDGERVSIDYEETVIGRDADISYPEDLFLSPRHALIRVRGESTYVEDLNSLNGTFIKLQVPVRLNPGDVFLMGRQVLRFSHATDTRAARASDNEGTRYMGSPHPTGTYRLEQIGVGGYTLDVYSVSEEGATIGRERGDIVFPRDKFMSSTHARISPVKNGEGFAIEDLDSSNGTWLRTNRQTRLNRGDFLFLGQQLFRLDYDQS
jgi:pSer/pThr/pTyr-binding forkhead associated (FHA) protein